MSAKTCCATNCETTTAVPDGTFKVVGTGDFVNVLISNNLNNHASEKRFARGITVGDLKGKLELITGANAGSMTINVHDEKSGGAKVCALTDDGALLGSYPVDDGMRLHVQDTGPKAFGEFDDLSKVEKYELTEEQYSKRTDTVRAYLQRNRLGKYNEEEMEQLRIEKEKEEAAEKALVSQMKVGDRCEAQVPGNGTRRGTVRFLGNTSFKEGLWVGIQYDEPQGKNDGSVNGKRYFECPDKYGGFVKPCYVKVGDYPEEELDFSDDEM